MRLILIVISSFVVSLSAHAQTFYTETGTAIFHSEVPLHSFSGRSGHLTGQIDIESRIVDFYLDLTTLETGIAKRDRDMRETLETDTFPFAEFYGELTTPFNPDSAGPQKVEVTGSFKIHGVEKKTSYSGTLEMTEKGLKIQASWVLLLKDFDIVPPSLLFVKVDQEQKIELKATLKHVEDK